MCDVVGAKVCLRHPRAVGAQRLDGGDQVHGGGPTLVGTGQLRLPEFNLGKKTLQDDKRMIE